MPPAPVRSPVTVPGMLVQVMDAPLPMVVSGGTPWATWAVMSMRVVPAPLGKLLQPTLMTPPDWVHEVVATVLPRGAQSIESNTRLVGRLSVSTTSNASALLAAAGVMASR